MLIHDDSKRIFRDNRHGTTYINFIIFTILNLQKGHWIKCYNGYVRVVTTRFAKNLKRLLLKQTKKNVERSASARALFDIVITSPRTD